MKLSDIGKPYKELDNYLTSYSIVETPILDLDVELPSNKYQRLLDYIDSDSTYSDTKPSNTESSDSTTLESNDGWRGWSFSKSLNNKKAQTINSSTKQYSDTAGKQGFDAAYNEVEKINPDAKKYRLFLTAVASRESNFTSDVQNRAGAPAWGYFLFMLDGKKYNNISHYANADIDTFLKNPKMQIEAAIKLAKDFENSITKADKILAKYKGLDLDTELGKLAALHAMWLAGPGGFRSWLQGNNPSDRKWSKTGAGTSVNELIRKYNGKSNS